MRRWSLVWLAGGLQTLLAVSLAFVPLFNLLGYEFSFAVGLLAVASGLAIGLTVGKHVPATIPGLGATLGLATLQLLPPLAVISLNAFRVRNCDYLEGLAFFALLPLATSVYAATWGYAIARVLARRRPCSRAGAAVLVALVPLALTVARLYFEPAIFAYDHLWGYFAGSLYDEAMSVGAPLLWLRAGTLLRIVGIGALLLLGERVPAGRRRIGLALAVVATLAMVELTVAPTVGIAGSRARIEAALPVIETRPGLIMHFPRRLAKGERAALVEEHVFQLERLTQRLGVTLSQPINSYVYANAGDKARLMGGRATMIAKPWLREIHIHEPSVPHPVLAHELAHVVAAELAPGPLHVSSRYGIVVNMGLVEGLAEAVTNGRHQLELDVYARAMRDQQILPDVRKIVGPAGFWTEAGARAYATAGSFVRFLLTSYGPNAVGELYAHADFEGTFHTTLDELVARWQAHLDQVTLTPRERRIAEELTHRPSLFARTCAREVAQLRDRAAHSEPQAAAVLYREIAEHLGGAPAARADLAHALARADDAGGFLALATELADTPALTSAQRSGLFEKRGDVAWKRGELDAARAAYERALALVTSFDAERMQWVKLWALRQPPELRDTLRDFLRGELAPLAAVLTLDRAPVATAEDRTLPYLVGRQLARVEAWERAIATLERAAAHPFPPIEAERHRLLGECLWRAQRPTDAARAYADYAELAPTSGERQQALEWVARLARATDR